MNGSWRSGKNGQPSGKPRGIGDSNGPAWIFADEIQMVVDAARAAAYAVDEVDEAWAARAAAYAVDAVDAERQAQLEHLREIVKFEEEEE